MLGKLCGSWNGWKAKVIVDMAGCGNAVFFIGFGPSARSAECSMVEMGVSTRIVISKAMNEEEWGCYMWSLGGIRTEIVNVER